MKETEGTQLAHPNLLRRTVVLLCVGLAEHRSAGQANDQVNIVLAAHGARIHCHRGFKERIVHGRLGVLTGVLLPSLFGGNIFVLLLSSTAAAATALLVLCSATTSALLLVAHALLRWSLEVVHQ
jgi:hypothetical protein